MYLKFLDKIKKQISHTKQGKILYHCISVNIFRSIAQQSVGLSSVGFLSVWTLKTLVYSPSTKNEGTVHQHIFLLVKPVAATPEPLKLYISPRSDVLLLTLIQVEGILKFVVNCDLIKNKN